MWPEYDEALTVDDEIEVVLQVNGKIRGRLTVTRGMEKDALTELALNHERIQELTAGKEIVRVIAVPEKLVNVVIKG
jgi:leucyl-tRNA synthetase